MRKRHGIAVLLAAALVVCSINGIQEVFVEADDMETEGITTFHRVMTGSNDGLIRYRYEDQYGEEVIPVQTTEESEVSSKKRAAALPESYDPRGTDTITPIRDQEDTGACWAFGALKALEGDVVADGLMTTQEADFSENHLAWYAYTKLQDISNSLYGDYLMVPGVSSGDIYNIGGNGDIAQFILANRWGAVMEADAPFAKGDTMAAVMEQAEESLRFQSAVQMTESNRLDYIAQNQQAVVDRNEVKQAILDHRAVDLSLYYDKRYLYDEDGITSMYQDRYTTEDANHCVTIVGWDDAFNTFSSEPDQSGAWLIANSYGETSGTMGGYFWVSYYDTSLCEYYTFEGVKGDTYDTCFQYDGCGWGNGYMSSTDIAIANVFTNQENAYQQVSAVSFYTYADGQSYDIDIYRNLGTGGPEDGEWVTRCSTAGIAEHSGYHTITLKEPIAVASGERFSAVVTFHPVGGTAYALIEGQTDERNGMYYSSKAGQSYICFEKEGIWQDNSLNGIYGEGNNNVCVKVFSNTISEAEYEDQQSTYVPATPVPRVTATPTSTPTKVPEKTNLPSTTKQPAQTADDTKKVTKITTKAKLTIGKGESATLSIKTVPSSGRSSLTYQSSNKKVVTVTKRGVVTGRKKGSARITVTAPSGVKKVVTVKVKKAPSSIKVTVAKQKLKKGKTTRLKVKLSKNSASYRIRYTSKNPKIISVSAEGKVKAKKPGTARIQVRTFNGKKATVRIKVVS